MNTTLHLADSTRYVHAIRASGLTIYDSLAEKHDELYIPTLVLEDLLNEAFVGKRLPNVPLRTRSKLFKQWVCDALGYPTPKQFKKTLPRFFNQNLDTYVQKSNNLQVWNEEIDFSRRYAIVRLSSSNTIVQVRVITGFELAQFDKTKKLTHKYQARIARSSGASKLITPLDTNSIRKWIVNEQLSIPGSNRHPLSEPVATELLPIHQIFNRLCSLIGRLIPIDTRDRERTIGGIVHQWVCEVLGYSSYQDDGQFPDIKHQLLEVKHQSSSTIDLGMIRPDNTTPIQGLRFHDHEVRPCDIRYAILCSAATGRQQVVKKIYLSTGESFFNHFPLMRGKLVNAKVQLSLPKKFFDT